MPPLPWQKVASDLFKWNGTDFLITADYYSRFFKVDKLNTLTSKAVTSKLKTLFARYVIPVVFISVNGPQNTSTELQGFAKAWGFRHLTSSPIYLQSKRTNRDISTDSQEPDDQGIWKWWRSLPGLLEYRNTFVDGLAAQGQLLMSHQLRSVLPCTINNLQKKVVPEKEFLNSRT